MFWPNVSPNVVWSHSFKAKELGEKVGCPRLEFQTEVVKVSVKKNSLLFLRWMRISEDSRSHPMSQWASANISLNHLSGRREYLPSESNVSRTIPSCLSVARNTWPWSAVLLTSRLKSDIKKKSHLKWSSPGWFRETGRSKSWTDPQWMEVKLKAMNCTLSYSLWSGNREEDEVEAERKKQTPLQVRSENGRPSLSVLCWEASIALNAERPTLTEPYDGPCLILKLMLSCGLTQRCVVS